MLSLSVASQWGRVNIYKLHSVFLLQVEIFLVEHVDTINHLLNKLNLRISQSVLVRDVVCAAWENRCQQEQKGTCSTFYNCMTLGLLGLMEHWKVRSGSRRG